MPKKPPMLSPSQFIGMKDDIDPKLIPSTAFVVANNFNFPNDGPLGMDKMLMPESVKTLVGTPSEGKAIDGIKEYQFVDTTNTCKDLYVVVSYGYMYLYDKTWTASNILYSVTGASLVNYYNLNITPGKVSIQVYANNLYISNGINYPAIFYGSLMVGTSTTAGPLWWGQMGAPVLEYASEQGGGQTSGATYSWMLTYVTAGGEEIIGTISAQTMYVSVHTSFYWAHLYIPIGYSGTMTRKLYRTKANGSTYYFITAIGDNTTMTIVDNLADASLTVAIGAVNNACPKPYFLSTANSCIYGAKNDLHPTQVYRTDAGIQVFDAANYIEIADQADDNTPVEGIGNDFGSILVTTAKNWYMLSPNASDATVTDVTPTRAFCGCKSGYTIKELASFGDFAGGLMFVSSCNDVRIITGMNALPISISVNNMRTQNYGQNIQGSLRLDLVSYTNIYAEYFDYCYHLVIDGNKYVFDIRTPGWTKHVIQTASYKSQPLVLAVLNLGTSDVPNYQLFNGHPDGTIEQEYSTVQYKGQDVPATLVSGYLLSAAEYKNVNSIRFWLKSYNSYGGTAVITVITDDNTSSAQSVTMTVPAAPFDSDAFDPRYFECIVPLDFQVININTNYRWLQYTIVCTTGSISLQKVELLGETLENQEG